MFLMEENVTSAEQILLKMFGCARLYADGTPGAEGKHVHIRTVERDGHAPCWDLALEASVLV